MPITITPNSPGNLFGPGLSVGLQSDFIGPLAQVAYFELDAVATSLEQLYTTMHLPTTTTSRTAIPHQVVLQGDTTSEFSVKPAPEAPISLRARLVEESTPGIPVIIDEETTPHPAVWSPVTNLVAVLPTSTTQGGGFTETDRQQLQAIDLSSSITQLVNALTLAELTNGPQGGFVSSFLPDTIFGVIVRLASIPSDLVPQTPDGDYWSATLAVVRVFRGSDLWLRVPIHTSNRLISIWDQSIVTGIATVAVAQWVLNLSVQVTFKDGVLGQVFLMRFP